MNTNREQMKIIIDLDGTICEHKINDDDLYSNLKPKLEVVSRLIEFKNKGFIIIIFTARGMRTYSSNLEMIKKNSLPIIRDWLDKWQVPYDEIIIGKPWCGDGFYVDDRSIRPSEFVELDESKIFEVISK
jgi:capsule biosynthesis phosphatase